MELAFHDYQISQQDFIVLRIITNIQSTARKDELSGDNGDHLHFMNCGLCTWWCSSWHVHLIRKQWCQKCHRYGKPLALPQLYQRRDIGIASHSHMQMIAQHSYPAGRRRRPIGSSTAACYIHAGLDLFLGVVSTFMNSSATRLDEFLLPLLFDVDDNSSSKEPIASIQDNASHNPSWEACLTLSSIMPQWCNWPNFSSDAFFVLAMLLPWMMEINYPSVASPNSCHPCLSFFHSCYHWIIHPPPTIWSAHSPRKQIAFGPGDAPTPLPSSFLFDVVLVFSCSWRNSAWRSRTRPPCSIIIVAFHHSLTFIIRKRRFIHHYHGDNKQRLYYDRCRSPARRRYDLTENFMQIIDRADELGQPHHLPLAVYQNDKKEVKYLTGQAFTEFVCQ